MEFKAVVAIEIKKDDRIYTFSMPQGAHIGEAYDAAHKVLEGVVKMANDAAEKAKPKDITEESNAS